jgi:hypothetical protein
LLTALAGDTASMPATVEAQDLTSAAADIIATSPTSEEVVQDSDIAILRGKYFHFIARILLIYIF